ncbi:hypothetical protein CYLTODRAFT_485970, partial [Cylindrobasidium torrendii FP15055 ss-10]
MLRALSLSSPTTTTVFRRCAPSYTLHSSCRRYGQAMATEESGALKTNLAKQQDFHRADAPKTAPHLAVAREDVPVDGHDSSRAVVKPPSCPARSVHRFPVKNALLPNRISHFLHRHAENGDPEDLAANRRSKLASTHLTHLQRIGHTQSPNKAWASYTALLALPPVNEKHDTKVPHQHLHRLVRLLGRKPVRNRELFLQLVSLMNYILRNEGNLHLHEWNLLIDVAGNGTRRPSPQDFKLAIDVFTDLINGLPPGHTFSPTQYPAHTAIQSPQPDIITYTTLLNHATKTLHGPALRQASALLSQSGIPPNRITLLCLLAYNSSIKSLSGVHQILGKMRREDIPLGIDGVNACIWAYARRERPDMVKAIYTILRHAVFPDETHHTFIVEAIARLENDTGMAIPYGMRPDEITFTAVIQAYAYSGDIQSALDVFLDMVSTDNLDTAAPMEPDATGLLQPQRYVPTMAVFRGIFLGYAKHGEPDYENAQGPWTVDALEGILQTFLDQWPNGEEEITKSLVYWIMVAFIKISGGDLRLVRSVWERLVDVFAGPWGEEGNRLQRLNAALQMDD